jgi:hypothetical protein
MRASPLTTKRGGKGMSQGDKAVAAFDENMDLKRKIAELKQRVKVRARINSVSFRSRGISSMRLCRFVHRHSPSKYGVHMQKCLRSIHVVRNTSSRGHKRTNCRTLTGRVRVHSTNLYFVFAFDFRPMSYSQS